MCGIGGLFDPGQTNNPNARSLAAAAMAKALAHRGPDGEGRFADADRGLDLVHRRLAVIDLSHQADQPMRSPNGRYVIIFNGEIYNYQEIARALNAEGIFFDARSDTRV